MQAFKSNHAQGNGDLAIQTATAVSTVGRMLPLCRFCGHEIHAVMADLGMQPIANALRRPQDLNAMEPTFPLKAVVCEKCLLVQALEVESAENLFAPDYLYFSSFSETMLAHARRFAEQSIARFGLNASSHVVEVACNDGYLLKWFRAQGIPVLGIEPAVGTAREAQLLGIPVRTEFFGKAIARKLASEGLQADLLPANNVVAHVPDINDFIGGFKILLKSSGVATFEFHHVLKLLRLNQFDAIYHEHYYYHSLLTFQKILLSHGLEVFDVEQIPTHGGSLRVYAKHADFAGHARTDRVDAVLAEEIKAGLDTLTPYLQLEADIRQMKRTFLKLVIEAKEAGKTIVAYGAAAKANTLLNYTGVGRDFIEYAVDKSPHKQGFHLPGVGIPILSPEKIFETRPDIVLVLCWNLVDEVEAQMAGIRAWGGKFLALIPKVRLF